MKRIRVPEYSTIESKDLVVMIDSAAPSWIGTDRRGEEILRNLSSSDPADVVRVRSNGNEFSRAWQDVATIASDAVRHRFATEVEAPVEEYPGRESALLNEPLRELWLHTNNSCNLACSHCLVSSGPDGDKGLQAEKLIAIIREARALGTRRFFFTGGEPLIRKDILAIIDAVLEDPDAELAILTNGIPLKGALLDELVARGERLRLQVSLDGSTPAINDPLRGDGSFHRIVEGIRAASEKGLALTITTVVTRTNSADVANVTRLVAECGARNHHLLWMHKRGRASSERGDATPEIPELLRVVDSVRKAALEHGVVFDNFEALKVRLRSVPGTKYDLAGAAVNTLCVYSDGTVYPSASMANIPELACGSVMNETLESVWRKSPVARDFRAMTVGKKEICSTCTFKFLCGGGDIEHAYFYGGSIAAHDPYCELHKSMIREALLDLTRRRRDTAARTAASGYSSPVVFTGMGDGAFDCASTEEHLPVKTVRSECVRSFDLDGPRRKVSEFYGDAAETPQEDLCCPVRPDADDLAHIPKDVIDRFYGCGSPVKDAAIRPGETTLDLGSGAGIDVFISAKKTGPKGKAIGVDMTDRMLNVAREQKPIVCENLGYDVVDFRKGFLEAIPVDDSIVDVVTSNCVVNLSPDKQAVFAEIWRVLRNGGRMVISDIISDVEVPPHQRKDPRLWGECISGALTQDELVAFLERTGFYGIQILSKSFWKDVEGYKFHAVTVRAWKFAKSDAEPKGHRAIYLGPFKGISTEEGQWFPRQVAVEVCPSTAEKLMASPYVGSFQVFEPDGSERKRCSPKTGCC